MATRLAMCIDNLIMNTLAAADVKQLASAMKTGTFSIATDDSSDIM